MSCIHAYYYHNVYCTYYTDQEGEYVHDVNALLDDDVGVHVTDDVVNSDDSEVEFVDDTNNSNNNSKQPKDKRGSSGEDYLRSVLLRLIYRCVRCLVIL
jgi:hypothetical protein